MTQRRNGVVGLGVRVGRRLFARGTHRAVHRGRGHHRRRGRHRRTNTRSLAPHRDCAATRPARSLSDVVRTRIYRHRHLAVAARSAPSTPRCSARSVRWPPWSRCRRSSRRICWSRSRSTPYLRAPSRSSGANRPSVVGPVGRDAHHSRRRQWSVQMREHHRIGIGGDTGFPADGERPGVRDRCAAAPDRCGRRRAGWPADAPVQAWTGARSRFSSSDSGRCSPLSCAGAPVSGAAEVDQHARRRIHIASLHRSATRRKRETRHTRKRPWEQGRNRKRLRRVEDTRSSTARAVRRSHERNADQSRTHQG